MRFKERIEAKVLAFLNAVDEKFFKQFGFYMKEASFDRITDYMYEPKDSSSLAVTRILFGLCMLFDIPNERGGASMERRWGDPEICHFPLLPFLQPLAMPYMAFVYAGLWIGAWGIMLGLKYRVSSVLFTLCYWYLFLAEKSYWNNHSYLFGLVALLLCFTDANCCWSIDSYLDPTIVRSTVPYWNYFILKYQFFILYFMAGMKKGTAEWLSGYSMRQLSEHWVFWPFRLFLTVPQIDYLIVHWFIFMFDLTIAVWMMISKTRHVAMVFCSMFHLMNSRLFRIGMFPWVCLATMPLFYPFDWPKLLLRKLENLEAKITMSIYNSLRKLFFLNTCACTEFHEIFNDDDDYDIGFVEPSDENEFKNENLTDDEKDMLKADEGENLNETENCEKNNGSLDRKDKMTMYFIMFHVVTQLFLPYSHFITKGYNNWTNGLYGYSWDMMVHSWETHAVIVKVVDNEKQAEFFIDPYLYTPTERWIRSGDMVHQYARCLKEKLLQKAREMDMEDRMSQNLSIYVDIWSSLNGRVTQRQFDPKVDLLKAEWSPFRNVSYLMPLLDEDLEWRRKLDAIREHVLTWNNKSDVVFLADFPGYEQEKFISTDLHNASLTILEGKVVYEPQVSTKLNGYSYILTAGDKMPLQQGTFHKVYNIGKTPAYYMYTFYNSTEEAEPKDLSVPNLPVLSELKYRLREMKLFLEVMVTNVGNVISCLSKCG